MGKSDSVKKRQQRDDTERIRVMLESGDMRTTGRVPEVFRLASTRPDLIKSLATLMLDPDPGIAMRAADTLEKVSVAHPDWLTPLAGRLVDLPQKSSQKEVLWHWCQMVTRLDLTGRQVDSVVNNLQTLLNSDSSIVATFALQALVDLAGRRPALPALVRRQVGLALKSPKPAVRARARKLSKQLD